MDQGVEAFPEENFLNGRGKGRKLKWEGVGGRKATCRVLLALQVLQCAMFVPNGGALGPGSKIHGGPDKPLRERHDGGPEIAEENEALKEMVDDQPLETARQKG